MGPLPPSEGYRYLFTRYHEPKEMPIRQQTAEGCVKALIGWVSRHEVPQVITSDWGGQLQYSLWHTLADSLGTKIVHTMTYNPEANGIIKRIHRSLKASLTARCQGRSWREELPWVLPDLRTSTHSAFNASPAEALYGQAIALLADIFQHPTSLTSPSNICKALERIMPAKMTYNMAKKVYIPNELQNMKCVHTSGRT
ncbi:uncharacterized protein [Macrobrachium rosenbergii]|uniref:uncharacterized protein n=1 Tax=Macrobrachium rosenbergii TaxID=79674 RepID=UPI0034D608EA